MEKSIVNKVIGAANLDAELNPHLPIVEIAGNHRVLIENLTCVCRYDKEKICVQTGDGRIYVLGCDLRIQMMAHKQILIYGEIHAVQFVEECGYDA